MSKRDARRRKRLLEKQRKIESEKEFAKRKEEEKWLAAIKRRERMHQQEVENAAILSFLLSRNRKRSTFTTEPKDVVAYPEKFENPEIPRIKSLIHEVCPGAVITTKEKSNEYRKYTEFTVKADSNVSPEELSEKFMELHRKASLEVEDFTFQYTFDFVPE